MRKSILEVVAYPPTKAQLVFITEIYNELGIEFTGTTKLEATDWLDENAPKYKSYMDDLYLAHEMEMEIIDGRRDW